MQIELEKKVRHSKHPVEEDLTFKRKTRSARQRQYYTLYVRRQVKKEVADMRTA